jgi:glycosyltransferase involved in cell wall biosynthesis
MGGAEIHVKNLFQNLIADGHEVTLITNERGDDMSGVIRVPWSKKNLLKLLLQVWKHSKDVAVIHAHYCHRLALFAGVVGIIRRKPVIITLHGMGILDHPSASRLGRLSHAFYRYWSLQLATYVISTSEDLALVADKYISRKKMTVIMNGYDAQKFTTKGVAVDSDNQPWEGKKVVMTLRRLVPKNGVQYLVECIPDIIKETKDVHFLLLGDGPLREQLETKVQASGVSSYVTFLGKVNNDSVDQFLRIADVVVFPSTAESSSIACAEAMGMKKSIVASRVGGLVELLGKDEARGYLVDLVPWTGSNYDAPIELPRDRYEALASRIIFALQHDAQSTQKAEAAERYAKNELSWQAIYEKTKGIYTSLIKS